MTSASSGPAGFEHTMTVCARCGVGGPVGPGCEACTREGHSTNVVVHGNVVWTAMRASLRCRSCGFGSPLDGIVTADGVECASCGIFQRFEGAAAWTEALAFAHEVGDLAGPAQEGCFPHPSIWIEDKNPYAGVGRARTFESRTFPGVEVSAAAGFPTCERCARPLDVRFEGRSVATHCGGCDATARYATPTVDGALVGAIAPEHREGRREVTVMAAVAGAAGTTGEGVTALVCPQCGASLAPTGAASAECTYCHTVSVIPARARSKQRGVVSALTFFVAFRGPTELRHALEQGRVLKEGVRKGGPGASNGLTSRLSRGLAPLDGVELAPRRTGLDVKQTSLTLTLTAFAVGAGWLVWQLLGS